MRFQAFAELLQRFFFQYLCSRRLSIPDSQPAKIWLPLLQTVELRSTNRFCTAKSHISGLRKSSIKRSALFPSPKCFASKCYSCAWPIASKISSRFSSTCCKFRASSRLYRPSCLLPMSMAGIPYTLLSRTPALEFPIIKSA